MSSAKLAKLESLSEEQAEHSRDLVERQRLELSQLDNHHSDLKRINLEYQNSLIGLDGVSPQQLAHRRSFVSQLTRKLDVLHHERIQKKEKLQISIKEHQQQSAQTAALGSMADRATAKEAVNDARIQQTQENETAQSLRLRAMSVREDDHV